MDPDETSLAFGIPSDVSKFPIRDHPMGLGLIPPDSHDLRRLHRLNFHSTSDEGPRDGIACQNSGLSHAKSIPSPRKDPCRLFKKKIKKQRAKDERQPRHQLHSCPLSPVSPCLQPAVVEIIFFPLQSYLRANISDCERLIFPSLAQPLGPTEKLVLCGPSLRPPLRLSMTS